MFRIVKIKITIVPLITSYTNLANLKHDTHSSVQTLMDFTGTLLTFRFVIASMRSMVLVFLSRTSPLWKHSVLFLCHCQRKPGRGHRSRSADSFQIPTTDYLSDMILKYSLFNLIDVFSCEFDHPPCFWLICIRLPSQFGVTCASYFSYLLPVFCAFFIYLDYLRFDPIVFMWWMILDSSYVFGGHANFRLVWLWQIRQF